jgi:hypothetical protein
MIPAASGRQAAETEKQESERFFLSSYSSLGLYLQGEEVAGGCDRGHMTA